MTSETIGEDPRPEGRTFHLVPEPVWNEQRQAAAYQPESFDVEGFIHCTDGEANLMVVANTFYRSDPRPYVVLVLDTDRLASPVRYDDPEQIYPHIYGPINREAVVEVRLVRRAADGSFLGIA